MKILTNIKRTAFTLIATIVFLAPFSLQGENKPPQQPQVDASGNEYLYGYNMIKALVQYDGLVVVDGLPILDKNKVEKIKAETIKSVEPLNTKKAVQLYGDRALRGTVLVMTLKKGELRPVRSMPSANKPMLVIDGIIIPEKHMILISSEDVKSVTVLKDEAAVNIYGEKGRNGVIIITRKSIEEIKEEIEKEKNEK